MLSAGSRRGGLLASAVVLPWGWLCLPKVSLWGGLLESCLWRVPAAARLLLQVLEGPGWDARHIWQHPAAHQGPHSKPTNVMDGFPLSHQPNPATEKTAGKTPIDLSEMRIRPSETSFQFIL